MSPAASPEFAPSSILRPPRISEHLTVAEFTTTNKAKFVEEQRHPPDGVLLNARRLAVDLFEPAHASCGRFHVTSGWRCPGLNAAVGGRVGSAHLEGRALDMEPMDVDRLTAFQRIAGSGLPFDELLWELQHGWIHVQVPRPGIAPRRLVLMTFDRANFEAWNSQDPRVLAG